MTDQEDLMTARKIFGSINLIDPSDIIKELNDLTDGIHNDWNECPFSKLPQEDISTLCEFDIFMLGLVNDEYTLRAGPMAQSFIDFVRKSQQNKS